MATKEHVIKYLNDALKEHPSTVNSQWYVGIAKDAKDRLFNDHNVDKDYGAWAHSMADSDTIARSVEKHFLDAGCDGGSGGGDSAPKSVYVYLKTAKTDP